MNIHRLFNEKVIILHHLINDQAWHDWQLNMHQTTIGCSTSASLWRSHDDGCSEVSDVCHGCIISAMRIADCCTMPV